MAETRIGISGWTYDHWRGRFYPEHLPRARELEFASRQFGSIELNASFYALQHPETYRRWYDATPPGFVFAVKGGRFITHNKRLRDVARPLANFLASGVLLLREKLGPILWQLPERLSFDEERVATFLALLPHDTRSAARLARRHDPRLGGRSWTATDRNRRLRHAIEARHESFFVPAFARAARHTGTAIVFSDSADWPYTEEITAGFVYLRLHGAERTYGSRYGPDALARWATRIRAWRAGQEPVDARRVTGRPAPPRRSRDVYAYFDNDQQAHAPADARELARQLGIAPA